ncbi:hypothetical protein GN956_G3707 [Arapaima gigas]
MPAERINQQVEAVPLGGAPARSVGEGSTRSITLHSVALQMCERRLSASPALPAGGEMALAAGTDLLSEMGRVFDRAASITTNRKAAGKRRRKEEEEKKKKKKKGKDFL